MTAYLASLSPNRYVLSCEHAGCTATFTPTSREAKYAATARTAARAAGWSTRTGSGPGGRTAPDLCPDHPPLPTTTEVPE